MSEVLIYRLRMNREAILQRLEPKQIIDHLYQEGVLDGVIYNEVRNEGSRRKQAELLLSCVERDSPAIQKMIDALEDSCQRHLACILNIPLPDEVQLSKGILRTLDIPYPMTHVPCGYAVIINNSTFDVSTKLDPREGSEKDVKRMEKLFKWLQFNVEIYQNKKAIEITSILRKYWVNTDHTKFDCFVLFLMSHGFSDGIFGTDGKQVYFQHIQDCFTARNCPSLASKPKIIFVQACRGSDPDKGSIVTDSPACQGGAKPTQEVGSYPVYRRTNFVNQPPDTNLDVKSELSEVPNDSDFMIAYASTRNHTVLRNITTGGWFVTVLDDVMRRYARTEDLQNIFRKVTGILSSKKSEVGYMQCPEQTGNLRRKLFFKPQGP